jgi:nucleoside-diphosphate-sugar epimerase
VRWWPADVRDAEAVGRVMADAKPDAVYHLASTAFNPPTIRAEDHLQTIVVGTANVLEALRDRPEVPIIATGSAAEYGSGAGLREDAPLRPATVLGTAKAAAGMLMQTYARTYGLRTVWLRLFTPYGSWERPARLIPHTILSALDRRDVQLTSGEQQRDYFFVDDLVEALRLAATRPLSGGAVLNVCSGRGTKIRDVVDLVLRLMGNPVRAQLGALPTRSDEILESSGNNTAAHANLGWSPRTTLEDGLRQTIEWFQAHRDVASQLS